MWTQEQWETVLFSDETAISQFKTYRPFVRRPKGTRMQPKYLAPTTKKSQVTMVWGAINATGVGPISIIPKGATVTGGSYKQLLQEHLRDGFETGHCQVFQHDGAPAHRSKTV